MKIFAATLITETNTFSPGPTGLGNYASYGIYHGDASQVAPNGMLGVGMVELRRLAEMGGHEVVESLSTMAQPAGRTVRHVYERFRDEILADLKRAVPVDAVVLLLHGAMVAEGYDDCEGDLIEAVREVVGTSVPIGVELDLHCHFTEKMRRNAEIIISYKEYPHTDGIDRLREVYALTMATAQGRIRPVIAVHDCRMVGIWHTTKEPMAGFVKHMQSLEGKNGILSVSFGHGFPWGDVPESGAKVWVVGDEDKALAQSAADQLGKALWEMREAARPTVTSIDDALHKAEPKSGAPIVLADIADNPGGGAPGDSTFILQRLTERRVGNVALGCLYDVGAVQMCREAGVGARLTLRIGGKSGPSSGVPVDLAVTVRGLLDEHSQSLAGMTCKFGSSAWVSTNDNIDIVLVSVREQTFSLSAFTGIGVDLLSKHIVVVKSTQHFHAEFAPIASEVIYVSTPGALTPDFINIPYRARDLNYWPRVADPFGGRL
ncbi:microcystin LR degradation protein MlrC-like protein [Pandoraea horticolens]|uniref:Microcystinase C n=1 Tax=Pandoraea horticolens TaxID=2508298 RepID=A0A5E4VRR5_9BURK|nr:M81 family metallopeptidase [Pandoraea horticolens]VVE13954.1 microcystin LR degradation protein MlrC-like protein [Pandoraea horticolens]